MYCAISGCLRSAVMIRDMSGSLFIKIAMHVTGMCCAMVDVATVRIASVSTWLCETSSASSLVSSSASESSTRAPRGDSAAPNQVFIASSRLHFALRSP